MENKIIFFHRKWGSSSRPYIQLPRCTSAGIFKIRLYLLY